MGRVGAQRSWCPDHSTTKPWYIVHRKATSTVDFCPNWESANPGPEDAVAVLWELARPLQQDGRVAEFNRVLAYVYASNTNAQPLGGEAMLTAVAKYVVGYCAKNPVQLENILSTIRQVSVGPVLPRATNSVLRSGATRCVAPQDLNSRGTRCPTAGHHPCTGTTAQACWGSRRSRSLEKSPLRARSTPPS